MKERKDLTYWSEANGNTKFYDKTEADQVMGAQEEEIRKLRYELAMAKAENYHTLGLLKELQGQTSDYHWMEKAKYIQAKRCHSIAEAYESRAAKILEGK